MVRFDPDCRKTVSYCIDKMYVGPVAGILSNLVNHHQTHSKQLANPALISVSDIESKTTQQFRHAEDYVFDAPRQRCCAIRR